MTDRNHLIRKSFIFCKLAFLSFLRIQLICNSCLALGFFICTSPSWLSLGGFICTFSLLISFSITLQTCKFRNERPILVLSLLRFSEMTSELITFNHLRCHSSLTATRTDYWKLPYVSVLHIISHLWMSPSNCYHNFWNLTELHQNCQRQHNHRNKPISEML